MRLQALGVVLAVLLVGCAQGQPAGSSPAPSSRILTPPPTSAGPSPATPSASGSSASAKPTKPAAPTVPDASGAVDVSKTVKDAGFASFASPSGKIWCAIYADDALCHFPFDYAGVIPDGGTVCPGESIDVTGAMVDEGSADYFCSGDPEADPRLGDSDSVASTAWWKATGWPKATLDGERLAAVPYGRSLVAGDYICASAKNGVTCANTATGKGFRIARSGVAFIS